MLTLSKKIKSFIETHQLLTTEKPVIVGFSGGCDSVALLFILKQSGYQCIAAHCNFRLRSDESDRDEIFCRQFAEQQEVIFEKTDFATQSYAAKHHLSIEMAARVLRYEWFESLRQKYEAQAIAVAHHRDDSNETLLINLIRGTGIRGLRGILPKNGWVVRPLLCVGKGELLQFVQENGLSFVVDRTNFSDDIFRNNIRLRLLPMMKELNPSVDLSLARTAEHLADVEKIYLHTIDHVRNALLKKVADEVFSISIADLSDLPAPQTLLYELLLPFGFTRQLSENVFHTLSNESGKIFNAPASGYQLQKDRDALLIYKKPGSTTNFYRIEDNITHFDIPSLRFTFQKVIISQTFEIDKSPHAATFDCDKLRFPLTLRKCRAGDWFIPFGMKGRKKISDYFTDYKFSRPQKDKTWLLCSGKDVIWVVGQRIDNRYRIDSQTHFALKISMFYADNQFVSHR